MTPGEAGGVWRFLDRLPVRVPLTECTPGSRTFRAEALGRRLGLSNLFVAFCGYWPERQAHNMTGSFKDLEAAVTLAALREQGIEEVSVVSAGNTARAYAYAGNLTGFPVVLVVPARGLEHLWLPCRPKDNLRVLVARDLTYSEAAAAAPVFLTGRLEPLKGPENLARRRALGTVLLEAVEVIGRLPDHYFQAVGSGIGALATHDSALALIERGGSGARPPRLHLAQNEPFAPVHRAFSAGRDRIKADEDLPDAAGLIARIEADVLANTHPLYEGDGGLFAALRSTGGSTYGITNDRLTEGLAWLAEDEGIDGLPPVGVALAALDEAVRAGRIAPDEVVLVNASGGGVERLRRDYQLFSLEPTLSLNVSPTVMNPRSLEETSVES